jgi:hypothetical protein
MELLLHSKKATLEKINSPEWLIIFYLNVPHGVLP